jgi:hypothetical protein
MEEGITEESVKHDFMEYIHNSKMSGKDLLAHIQSHDFEGKKYKYHYTHQDTFLKSIEDPNYTHYTPEGKPEVVSSHSPTGAHHIVVHWMTLDNPTPGFKTTFIMDFKVEKIK